MKLLGINAATSELRWPIGSPYRLRLRMKDATGAFQDLTGREFVFAVYRATVMVSADATISSDAIGSYAEFYFDGAANATIANASSPIWEIAEIYTDGKALILTGAVYIADAAAIAEQGDTASSAYDEATWAPELDTVVVTETGARGATGRDALPYVITLSGATTSGLNNPRDVYPVGDLCYVTNNGNSSISIFDTSTSPPTLISDTTHSGLVQFRSVVVAGKYLFATVQGTSAAPGNSFAVFDVSDPSAPVFVTNMTSAHLWRPACNVLAGNVLLVSDVAQLSGTTVIAGSRLTAFDVSDPANPVELGTWPAPNNATIGKFAVKGTRAFVALQGPLSTDIVGALHVVDFSDPTAMVSVGNVALQPVAGIAQAATDLVYENGYCYLACEGCGGFTIIDVNTPAAPVQVAYQPLPTIVGGSQSESTGIWIGGDFLHVTDLLNSRYYVYDVSNKAAPALSWSSTTALFNPARMVAQGTTMYLANRAFAAGPTAGGLGYYGLGGPVLPSLDCGSARASALRVDGLSSFDRAIVHGNLNVGGNTAINGRLGVLGPFSALSGQIFKGGAKIYNLGVTPLTVVAEANPASMLVSTYGSTAAIYVGLVAGGTEAAPTTTPVNSQVSYRFNFWNGAVSTRFAEIRGTLIEPTPGQTAGGGRVTILANAPGTITNTEIARFEVATGLSMFSGNVVIDGNRHHVLREYTKAQILAIASPSKWSVVACSDAAGGACPVFYDGTAWQKLSFAAL